MLLDRETDQLVTEKRDPGAVPCRTLSLSDALILMVALGLALAWDRGRYGDPTRWISFSPTNLPRTLFPSTPSGWPLALAVYAINGVELLPPFLIVGSLAVLVLRLRTRLPVKRWLFWQPGASACAVASVPLIATGLLFLVMYLQSYLSGRVTLEFLARRSREDLMPEHLTAAATAIGYGVAGTWIALAAKRRWRPEPGWIDGLGRLVGVGWIVMVIGGMILPIVQIARMGLSG
jgi:hypothetical protein